MVGHPAHHEWRPGPKARPCLTAIDWGRILVYARDMPVTGAAVCCEGRDDRARRDCGWRCGARRCAR